MICVAEGNMRKLNVASVVAAMGSIACASAQTYPARPITMIVPFAARRAERYDRTHPGGAHACLPW
jgi:hypothetical protein